MTGDPDRRPPTAAEARAEVEARRERDRAERAERFERAWGGRPPGRWIGAVSWAATALLAVSTVAAVVEPDLVGAFLAVAMGEFLVGSALFCVVLVLAAGRSRDDAMGIGGLFFLAGSAPPAVQRSLLGSLGTQVVVSTVGAAVRPFTPLAFGTLAPMLGLALCGLWAVRHGLFPARASEPAPGPRRAGRDGGAVRRG